MTNRSCETGTYPLRKSLWKVCWENVLVCLRFDFPLEIHTSLLGREDAGWLKCLSNPIQLFLCRNMEKPGLTLMFFSILYVLLLT